MMARLLFDWVSKSDGATLRLMEKSWLHRAEPVSVEDWADRISDSTFSGISRILALLDDLDSPVERSDGGLFLDHPTIASLTEPQALGLGLPPSVRVALQVETKNLITDPDFRILGRWVGEANRLLRAEREGAFLRVEGQSYRLPDPLFSLVEAIDAFAAADNEEDHVRMARLAHLQSLIPQAAQDQHSLDAYFSSFRVLHASAFSLSLKIAGRSFDFDPILFG